MATESVVTDSSINGTIRQAKAKKYEKDILDNKVEIPDGPDVRFYFYKSLKHSVVSLVIFEFEKVVGIYGPGIFDEHCISRSRKY